MSRLGRYRGLGVALGPTGLATVELDGRTRAWSHPVAPLADGAVQWPALVTALQELRRARGGRGGALAVALLPPLVEVRPVTLPPLAAEEARQVLARAPGRYFLGAREPQVIGLDLTATRRDEHRGPHAVIAAAAPARVLDAIHTAAAQSGWSVTAVVPAEAAWHAAALAIWPVLREGSHDVAVLRVDRTELLRLDAGALTGVRRQGAYTPDAAPDDALARAAVTPGGAPAGGLAILGPASLRDSFLWSMGSERGRALLPPAAWAALAESAEGTAAAFAPRAGSLAFVSDAARLRASARRTRLTAIAAIVAAALVVIAAGFEFWGARRALAAVQRERAALRPRTSALVAMRDSAALVGLRLGELAVATRHATPWSEVLTTVTHALPRDAYLTAFRATGDSIVLDGVAESAAGVFTAIKNLPGFTDVRSAAPVRQQLGDRATATAAVLERFSVAARLAPARDTLGLALGAAGRRP